MVKISLQSVILENKFFYNNLSWYYKTQIIDLTPFLAKNNSINEKYFIFFRLITNSIVFHQLDLKTEKNDNFNIHIEGSYDN